MCQYLVFFIISFLTFGLDKRLLKDPASIDGERRDLGMFGQKHERRHYADYFAHGHPHSRQQSRQHQLPVGDDKTIEVHKLTKHFPFDKDNGYDWEQILQRSKEEADQMAAKAKAVDDAEMKQQNAKEKEDKKKEDAGEKAKEDAKKKTEKGDDNAGTDSDDSDESSADDSQGGDKKSSSKLGPEAPPPAPGKHGLTENRNYVPDNVPRKKACEFTPANCFCGARPTQQMDLLCASKKREYCGWFCKHKMGGREGKPKTGPGQYGGVNVKPLKPENRANPEGCPKPSLKTCEAIYSDPNSPDYVGDGYAPPGANCVCHIDQKSGHAVITDIPNSAALPAANGKAGAPAAAKGAPSAAAKTDAAPKAGAPKEQANAGGAGPDSGNAAPSPIDDVANSAVKGIQRAQNTANVASAAAADTANAASDAAGKVQEGGKSMWDHAKGFAKAAGGHIGNAASSVWNGVKNVGKAIFGDEAEAEVQGSDPGVELYLNGGKLSNEHPSRAESALSNGLVSSTRDESAVSNGLNEVLEYDETALGVPGDFGVHR